MFTPPDVLEANANGILLFNKWDASEVEVKDISLTDYIQVRNAVLLPHTAGRYATRQFRKSQMPIVERLVNRSAARPFARSLFRHHTRAHGHTRPAPARDTPALDEGYEERARRRRRKNSAASVTTASRPPSWRDRAPGAAQERVTTGETAGRAQGQERQY